MKISWITRSLLIICSTFLLGCGTPQKEVAQQDIPTADNEPELTEAKVKVRGGKIQLADATGNRLWEAQADSIEGDFLSGEGIMQNVKCTLLEADISAITAEAKEAVYQPQANEIILRGGVKAEWAKEDATIHADQVTFSLEKKTIEARGNVRLISREQKLQGDLLRTDVELGVVELTNGGENR